MFMGKIRVKSGFFEGGNYMVYTFKYKCTHRAYTLLLNSYFSKMFTSFLHNPIQARGPKGFCPLLLKLLR